MSECREIAEKLIRKQPFSCEIVGSLRRGEEYSHDVDIVCADESIPHRTEHINRFTENTCSIDLYRAHPDHYGSMILAYTGPQGSTIGMRRQAARKGMILNQYGLFDRQTGEPLAFTEEEICQKVLNRPCKPPALRGK